MKVCEKKEYSRQCLKEVTEQTMKVKKKKTDGMLFSNSFLHYDVIVVFSDLSHPLYTKLHML